MRWKSEFSHLAIDRCETFFMSPKKKPHKQSFTNISHPRAAREKKEAASPVGTRARRLPTTEPLRSNYSSAIRQTYLFCATSLLLLLIDEGGREGAGERKTHANKHRAHARTRASERASERARARLWSAKMSASLGEAHMHFREVPLIRREIQLKTWSGSPPRFDTAPDSSRR